MNLEKILAQYDAMFGNAGLQEIEAYLVSNIAEAKAQDEMGIVVTLLNEIIGFCRDTTQKEKALQYCDELQDILKKMKLEGRIDYATSLLNVANAYRAFGLFEESRGLYHVVESVYEGQVSAKDFMYAGLYNNWSLLYQEMGEYEAARDMLLKALIIADSYEEAVIPQATTRTNLAATLLQIGTDEAYEEAVCYLQEALAVFEKDGGKDFHYGAALVAMGDACSYKNEFENAAGYYEKGLAEIEKHVGRTDNYTRVLEKYHHVRRQAGNNTMEMPGETSWTSNLERSKAFYEAYGREMIHTKFPEYEDKIAVGLVGEGSDCFGFDDEISTDHDYETGFCMWLTDDVYQKIGEILQKEYENLILTHTEQKSKDMFLQNRRGVFSVNEFYNTLLEFSYESDAFWENADEYKLAAAVNGAVFRDDVGAFSKVRAKLLSYYPEMVWRKKLAQCLHDFSQYAQSNYARMMARNDVVTAYICIGKAIEATMNLVYLLHREYAPYYKWKKKGMESFPLGQEILPLLDELARLPEQSKAWAGVTYNAMAVNKQDMVVVIFEKMAVGILQEMERQNLVTVKDTFLENYISQVLEGKNMDIIEKIVELEWKQFDKVKNEGGRAGCQDDFTTFSIMRKSQYLTWPEELLDSYCNDLLEAKSKGWNLITEKYARMMKSTAPEKYAELEKELPLLSDERIAIQEEIIKIQVAWMEDFAEKYPKMAGNARSIHTSEDTPFNTSYETYLRGELGTYSETTFILYGRFITGLLKENRNLAYETMSNTAGFYGYENIEAAEAGR